MTAAADRELCTIRQNYSILDFVSQGQNYRGNKQNSSKVVLAPLIA